MQHFSLSLQEENDEVFSSPVESESEESIDSDFDRSEESAAEQEDAGDEEPKRKRRAVSTKAYKVFSALSLGFLRYRVTCLLLICLKKTMVFFYKNSNFNGFELSSCVQFV